MHCFYWINILYAAGILGLCTAFPISAPTIGESNTMLLGFLALTSIGVILGACICCKRRKRGFEEFTNESGVISENRTEFPIFRPLSSPAEQCNNQIRQQQQAQPNYHQQQQVIINNNIMVQPGLVIVGGNQNNSRDNLLDEDYYNNNEHISPADMENIENNNAVDFVPNLNTIGIHSDDVEEQLNIYSINRSRLLTSSASQQQSLSLTTNSTVVDIYDEKELQEEQNNQKLEINVLTIPETNSSLPSSSLNLNSSIDTVTISISNGNDVEDSDNNDETNVNFDDNSINKENNDSIAIDNESCSSPTNVELKFNIINEKNVDNNYFTELESEEQKINNNNILYNQDIKLDKTINNVINENMETTSLQSLTSERSSSELGSVEEALRYLDFAIENDDDGDDNISDIDIENNIYNDNECTTSYTTTNNNCDLIDNKTLDANNVNFHNVIKQFFADSANNGDNSNYSLLKSPINDISNQSNDEDIMLDKNKDLNINEIRVLEESADIIKNINDDGTKENDKLLNDNYDDTVNMQYKEDVKIEATLLVDSILQECKKICERLLLENDDDKDKSSSNSSDFLLKSIEYDSKSTTGTLSANDTVIELCLNNNSIENKSFDNEAELLFYNNIIDNTSTPCIQNINKLFDDNIIKRNWVNNNVVQELFPDTNDEVIENTQYENKVNDNTFVKVDNNTSDNNCTQTPQIKIDHDNTSSEDMSTVTPVNTPIELNYSVDSWDRFITTSLNQNLVTNNIENQGNNNVTIDLQEPNNNIPNNNNNGWFLHPQNIQQSINEDNVMDQSQPQDKLINNETFEINNDEDFDVGFQYNEIDDTNDQINLSHTFDLLRRQLAEALPHAQGVTNPHEFSDDEDSTSTTTGGCLNDRTFDEYCSPFNNYGIQYGDLDEATNATNILTSTAHLYQPITINNMPSSSCGVVAAASTSAVEMQKEMIINYKRALSPIMEESEDETCRTFILNETRCLDNSTSTGCLETGEAIMGVTKTLMASNDTLFNFEDTLGEREDILSPRACSQADLNDNKLKEQTLINNNNKTSEDLISEALISLTTVTATSSDPLHESKHIMDQEIDNQHDDLNNKNFKNRMIKPKSFEGLSSFNDNNGLTLSDIICSPEQPKSFSDYIDGGDTTYTTNTIEDRTCISVHQLKDDVIERISDISEPDWGISTISLSGKADLNNSLNDIPSLIEGLTNEEESDMVNEENDIIDDSLDKASLNMNNTEDDNIVFLDIDSLEANDDKSENENNSKENELNDSDNIIKDSLLHNKCNGDDENKENFNQENVNNSFQTTMMHISGAIETKVNNKQNDEKSMQQQHQMNHQQQLPIETSTTTINDNFLEKEIEYSSSQYYYKNNLANIISTNELTTIPIAINNLNNNNNILLINNVPNLINNKNILNENHNYKINNLITTTTVPTGAVSLGRLSTKPVSLINCLSNNLITDDNDNNSTTVILTSATTGISVSDAILGDVNEEQIIPNNYIRQKNYLMNINNAFNNQSHINSYVVYDEEDNDYVTCANLVNPNNNMENGNEISDIRFAGPCADVISTSFTLNDWDTDDENNDEEEDEEDDQDNNDDDNDIEDDSNSSEEFMYMKGNKNVQDKLNDGSLYDRKMSDNEDEHFNNTEIRTDNNHDEYSENNKIIKKVDNDCINNKLSPDEGTCTTSENNIWTKHEDQIPVNMTSININSSKHDTPSDIDTDDCSSSDADGEFVPSCWDSMAQPARSALKSPDKSSSVKKRRSVVFKKQRYHSIYEYPREIIQLSPAYSEPQIWENDFNNIHNHNHHHLTPTSPSGYGNLEQNKHNYNNIDGGGFMISSTTRPFHGSQFHAQCNTWPQDTDFSWSQMQDEHNTDIDLDVDCNEDDDLINEQHSGDQRFNYAEYNGGSGNLNKINLTTNEWSNANCIRDYLTSYDDSKDNSSERPDSGVGESTELSESVSSLGDLCHTKSTLRLPLNFTNLKTNNIDKHDSEAIDKTVNDTTAIATSEVITVLPSDQQNSLDINNFLLSSTPSCTGSMDSLSSSSCSSADNNRQLTTFTTFGKLLSSPKLLNKNNENNKFKYNNMQEHQQPPTQTIILIDTNLTTEIIDDNNSIINDSESLLQHSQSDNNLLTMTSTDSNNLINNKLIINNRTKRQSDSTDEDSGIENLNKIN